MVIVLSVESYAILVRFTAGAVALQFANSTSMPEAGDAFTVACERTIPFGQVASVEPGRAVIVVPEGNALPPL